MINTREQEINQIRSRATADLAGDGPMLGKSTLAASPLERIEDRIFGFSLAAHDIAAKLNQHADEVYGRTGGTDREGAQAAEEDMPAARLDRIFLALDKLAYNMTKLSEAAGRNCTLA